MRLYVEGSNVFFPWLILLDTVEDAKVLWPDSVQCFCSPAAVPPKCSWWGHSISCRCEIIWNLICRKPPDGPIQILIPLGAEEFGMIKKKEWFFFIVFFVIPSKTLQCDCSSTNYALMLFSSMIFKTDEQWYK